MGSGKWFFLAGMGAGAFLALRMNERQIEGIKSFTSRISQSENLNEARRIAEDKVTDTLRQQGSNLVDRLADRLKEQINSIDLNNFAKPDSSVSSATDSSTTSTMKGDDSTNKDGHVIIDGKIVS
ncbi:MAG: hypothetical protein SPK50_00385 [Mobiluncus porci]|uniref:hypothetical protein n=1 Tax=Mobiluncus TaxID=2050 RepID=UPI0023F379B0|nr:MULTISPECIES: hypothetical protein [Mobiluncus]MCI6585264.1 hypothetical protein [Mobiluncus sp.]MDD7541118.1 hypothetical protein [Mobiluncus porci]MDY5747577.1 hypothetical protein [Mobiluncus porci]